MRLNSPGVFWDVGQNMSFRLQVDHRDRGYEHSLMPSFLEIHYPINFETFDMQQMRHQVLRYSWRFYLNTQGRQIVVVVVRVHELGSWAYEGTLGLIFLNQTVFAFTKESYHHIKLHYFIIVCPLK